MLAAVTPLPVIGVPVPLKYLDGMDSLLSIVQMPAGVPVATVAIGNARNAGLLAVRILAAADPALLDQMIAFQQRAARSGGSQGRGGPRPKMTVPGSAFQNQAFAAGQADATGQQGAADAENQTDQTAADDNQARRPRSGLDRLPATQRRRWRIRRSLVAGMPGRRPVQRARPRASAGRCQTPG